MTNCFELLLLLLLRLCFFFPLLTILVHALITPTTSSSSPYSATCTNQARSIMSITTMPEAREVRLKASMAPGGWPGA